VLLYTSLTQPGCLRGYLTANSVYTGSLDFFPPHMCICVIANPNGLPPAIMARFSPTLVDEGPVGVCGCVVELERGHQQDYRSVYKI
jgi:hypothetical protein